jgi:Smg protein
MKETVLDVLMYLFESYVESPDDPEPSRLELKRELGRAGFHDREIERALDWLDGLNATGVGGAGDAPQNTAFRVFDSVEQERLDAPSRGYLLHLEQIGILQPAQREVVIDRLMALDNDETDIEQTKWVVMMVLFSQPGRQDAFAQMEDLVYADDSAWVH